MINSHIYFRTKIYSQFHYVIIQLLINAIDDRSIDSPLRSSFNMLTKYTYANVNSSRFVDGRNHWACLIMQTRSMYRRVRKGYSRIFVTRGSLVEEVTNSGWGDSSISRARFLGFLPSTFSLAPSRRRSRGFPSKFSVNFIATLIINADINAAGSPSIAFIRVYIRVHVARLYATPILWTWIRPPRASYLRFTSGTANILIRDTCCDTQKTWHIRESPSRMEN